MAGAVAPAPTRLRLPHPVVLLGGAVAVAAVLTFILPAGQFDRRDDAATGRRVVVRRHLSLDRGVAGWPVRRRRLRFPAVSSPPPT